MSILVTHSGGCSKKQVKKLKRCSAQAASVGDTGVGKEWPLKFLSKTLGIRQVTGTSLLLQKPPPRSPPQIPELAKYDGALRYFGAIWQLNRTALKLRFLVETCHVWMHFPWGRRQQQSRSASATQVDFSQTGITWDEVWVPHVMTHPSCKITSLCSTAARNEHTPNTISPVATAQRAHSSNDSFGQTLLK